MVRVTTSVVPSCALVVLRRGLLDRAFAATSPNGEILSFFNAERVAKVLLRKVGGHRLFLVLLGVDPIGQAVASFKFFCLEKLHDDCTVLTVVLDVELALSFTQVGARRSTRLVLLMAITVQLTLVSEARDTEQELLVDTCSFLIAREASHFPECFLPVDPLPVQE